MSHYGLHWEWRGFGHLTPEAHAHFDTLKPRYPDAERVTDEYLWVPGCKINVKLRSKGTGSLKFKRCHRVDGELHAELWLEDEAEEYALPVEPPVVLLLARSLGLTIPEPKRPLDRSALASALGAAGARVVRVEKIRRQYNLVGHGVNLIAEHAQLLSPESLDSVAIESEADLNDRSSSDDVMKAGRSVAAARDRLPFAGTLKHLNYLEALAVWAGGHRVGE